jgi:hypothetical protein
MPVAELAHRERGDLRAVHEEADRSAFVASTVSLFATCRRRRPSPPLRCPSTDELVLIAGAVVHENLPSPRTMKYATLIRLIEIASAEEDAVRPGCIGAFVCVTVVGP